MGQHMSSMLKGEFIDTMKSNPVHINVKEKKVPEQKKPEQNKPEQKKECDENITSKNFIHE
tara:strand:+ start:431 stop:613 length:183 start_codon:yes stop_codon:yes gene_type:complete